MIEILFNKENSINIFDSIILMFFRLIYLYTNELLIKINWKWIELTLNWCPYFNYFFFYIYISIAMVETWQIICKVIFLSVSIQ